MEVHTTGGISGPNPIEPNRVPAGRLRPAETPRPGVDRAEISDHARFLAKLRDVPEVRRQKVEALRALIASGKYETPERISGAVDKIMEELD
jgi:anti-sigma28 factor (negative regulator of flagellin synthesis)